MSAFPTVRIEIDSGKLNLVKALEARHKEIEAAIIEQLDAIDIVAITKSEVDRSLGPIIKECVEKSVKNIITDIFHQNNWNFYEALKEAVENSVKENILNRLNNDR